MFGQRSQISQAYISKITHGKPTVGILALKQLNYIYGLHSTDVLHRTIRRIPSKYHSRWAAYCFNLRQYKEKPPLSDLEFLLHKRILAAKKAHLPHKVDEKKIFQTENNEKWVGKTYEKSQCILCKQQHYFYKCDNYKEINWRERIKLVKKEEICFNCLKGNRCSAKYTSKNRCFQKECAKKHTSLHDYFVKKKAEDDAVEDVKKISLFHMKIIVSVAKSLHQYRGLGCLHLLIFFLIHTLSSSAGK